MPIVYKESWNRLNLAKLTKDGENIALFWKAKARMKAGAAARLKELEHLQERETLKTLTGPERKAIKAMPIATEKAAIENALKRDKVTSSMVKKFGNFNEPAFGAANAKDLDRTMEQIHNDRLRLSDCDMLKKYSAARLTLAMFDAKSKFTSNLKVAALLARATAEDGEAVTVTQGVHQADDPHFDVLMPGEAQQYHVDVEMGEKLTIKSISYMNGATKAAGATEVLPDGVAAVVV